MCIRDSIKAFKKTETHVLEFSPFKLKEGFGVLKNHAVELIRSAFIGVGVGKMCIIDRGYRGVCHKPGE